MDPHTSIFGYYTRFNGGLLSTISYITLFYAAINNLDKKDLRQLFVTMFGSALLVSLYAIPEHFGHSLSCWMINLDHHVPNAPFDDSCWIQDVKTRVFATFGQPNWLAAYAITLMPVGLVLSSVSRRKLLKAFYFLTTLALFVTLIFTKSRSGVGGLVVGLGLFGLGYLFFLWRKKSLSWNLSTMMFGAAAAIVMLALLFGTPYTPDFGEAFWQKTFDHQQAQTQPTPNSPTAAVNRLDIGGTDSGDIRRIVWTGAIRVWQRYPIFGSGVETFAYSYYRDRPMEHNLVSEWDFLYNKAHNEFLNYLATTGVLGFGTYVLMLGAFILLPLYDFGVAKVANTDSDPLFALAFSCGLIALSISNFFGFSTVMVSALLFLYPAFFVIIRGKSRDITHTFDASAFSQNLAIGFIAIIAIGLFFMVCSWWFADFYFASGKLLINSGKTRDGLALLQESTVVSPNEGLFYDQLASVYSRLAVAAASEDATAAAQLANQSLLNAQQMLALNPINLNFYKTDIQVLSTLSQLQPDLLNQAQDQLHKAIALAPTDPKLAYYLAAVELSLHEQKEGLAQLEKTVQMKPDYEPARVSLGQQYETLGRKQDAIDQFKYVLEKIQPNNETAKKELQVLTK